jgi:DNA-binding CsgD family transcriptional regulator
LRGLGRIGESAEDARRALAIAREVGHPVAELFALAGLALAASDGGDHVAAVPLAWQAARVTEGVPGVLARTCSYYLTIALVAAGDLAAAERVIVAGLAGAREAGDLLNQATLLPRMVNLDLRAGRTQDAAAHLREGLHLAVATGNWTYLTAALHHCAEYALMLAESLLTENAGPPQASSASALGRLSAREKELVTLVARGCTNAQIAAELFISVRTVSSHLDRIRDKTGCRRRADLIRLALTAGLV